MKGPADVAHGPMFIDFMINVILYGIMITQVYIYFANYKKGQPCQHPVLLKSCLIDRDRTWMVQRSTTRSSCCFCATPSTPYSTPCISMDLSSLISATHSI